MSPYYSDDSVTLYHGDAADVLPTIAPESVDVLLTDPPYFQVKDEDWDRQWKKRGEFLTWLGDILDAASPALLPSASVWVFASPLLTSTVEREVISPRFRLLNSIRWVKEAGWHQKAEIEAQRRYLTAWEGLLLAESADDAHTKAAEALHYEVFRPLGRYFQEERERAGWTRSDLEVALGYVSKSNPERGTALCYRWEVPGHGWCLPTRDAYNRARVILGPSFLRREYVDLVAESERRRVEFERRRSDLGLRRPFRLTRSGPVTDVWNFPPVMGYPGKHPCEKPLAMLDHMIGVSSKPGAMILDPFVGSGSTLRAAKDAGRRAIGIEKDERWCEHAANRLTQDVLDFGDGAA